MKSKSALALIFLIFSSCALAQNSKELRKDLIVLTTSKFDSRGMIFFERKNPKKHGWDKVNSVFSETFSLAGFNVAKTPSTKSKYIFLIDYDYGYLIAAYKMQYSDMKGEILDTENNLEVVGSFSFHGRYNNDNVAEAMAINLKNKTSVNITKEEQVNKVKKSKEDKLRELKELFEKELISKEEYETSKKKILEEE